MLDEEAKAVQEVAKVTGKGIDMVTSAGGLLKQLFGDSIEQFGGAMGDWARFYRQTNLLHLVDRYGAMIADRKLAGKPIPIPLHFALPLLDGASLEGDDEVRELWAGLLANATDPTRKLVLKKIYIEILRGLQPLDVHLLKVLSEPDLDSRFSVESGVTLNAELLAGLVEAEVDDVQISLQTLARNGCVLDAWETSIHGLDSGYSGFRVNNPKSSFRLSHLGQKLVAATSTSRTQVHP